MARVLVNIFLIILKGWIASLSRVMGFPLKRPWMHCNEIAIISEILRGKRPKRCFEWGSGYGTYYYSKMLDEDALWISVEDNQQWYEKIKPIIKRQNTRLYHIPPNQFPWTDEYGDGAYSDLKDYVEFPNTFNMEFDFILVDGHARNDCIRSALNILSKDGVIVLHNANREYYHKALKPFDNQVYFNAYNANAALWIGSKHLPLRNLLDIKKHEDILVILGKLRKIRAALAGRKKK